MSNKTKQLVISALLLAVGLVLPFLTGSIPNFGRMLLPMHLPVFLCGLICGWQYGLAVGLILPVMRRNHTKRGGYASMRDRNSRICRSGDRRCHTRHYNE